MFLVLIETVFLTTYVLVKNNFPLHNIIWRPVKAQSLCFLEKFIKGFAIYGCGSYHYHIALYASLSGLAVIYTKH